MAQQQVLRGRSLSKLVSRLGQRSARIDRISTKKVRGEDFVLVRVIVMDSMAGINVGADFHFRQRTLLEAVAPYEDMREGTTAVGFERLTVDGRVDGTDVVLSYYADSSPDFNLFQPAALAVLGRALRQVTAGQNEHLRRVRQHLESGYIGQLVRWLARPSTTLTAEPTPDNPYYDLATTDPHGRLVTATIKVDPEAEAEEVRNGWHLVLLTADSEEWGGCAYLDLRDAVAAPFRAALSHILVAQVTRRALLPGGD